MCYQLTFLPILKFLKMLLTYIFVGDILQSVSGREYANLPKRAVKLVKVSRNTNSQGGG